MCHPFAMVACSVMGTARPEATSRGARPPRIVHMTGRSEKSRAAGTRLSAEEASTTTRYASLLIRFKYTRKGRNPSAKRFANDASVVYVLRSIDLTSRGHSRAVPGGKKFRLSHLPRRQRPLLGSLDGTPVVH